MTVTIVTTAQRVSLLPSVTTSQTPAMGVGVAGSNQTVNLSPE